MHLNVHFKDNKEMQQKEQKLKSRFNNAVV